MSRGVLLDTNLLIKAFDQGNDTSTEARQAAKQKLRDLLEDDSVAFAISPLIRYELLRHVDWGDEARYQKLEPLYERFTEARTSNSAQENTDNINPEEIA